jgi:BASS family bile acid:Na+ symporter
MALTTVTNMAAPVVVPVAFLVLTGQAIEVSPAELFLALCLILILPILVHIPLRQTALVQRFVSGYGGAVSMLLVCTTILIVAGKQRAFLLHDLRLAGISLGVLFAAYAIFYIVGWFAVPRVTDTQRLTFSIASGVNNNGLGIALAFLYLPEGAAMLIVLSEIPWAASIAALSLVRRGRWRLSKLE